MPILWESHQENLARIFHEFTPWRDCDHGYGCPSWRPRVSVPATYRSGTPRNQSRGTSCQARGASACAARGTPILFALAALRSVPQAGSQFGGLATAIHEISGLVEKFFTVEAFAGKMAKCCHKRSPLPPPVTHLRRGIFDRVEEFRREVSNGFAGGAAK